MEISGMLGIGAAVIHTIAYLYYNKDVIKGTRKPNGPTWAIWSAIAILSATSYFAIVGDWAKSVLSFVNILSCTATFILALVLKRFARPDKIDYVALILGLAAAVVWWWYKSALYANLILQLAIIVGFIPTLRLVWKSPRSEQPGPWLIWTLGYAILVVTITMRWRGQWYDLIYPINSIIFHTAVAALSIARLMQFQHKHNLAKKKILASVTQQVVCANNPVAAVDVVLSYDPIYACALIDQIDQLTAAMILGQMKMELPWVEEDSPKKKLIESILARAEQLQISGTKGILYARNELFRRTGRLLV